MSCSKCGSVNTSCGCKDTAYTTPKVYTCPPDTSCPQPVRCSEFMDAACIFLNDGIADAGIQPGSSLESIVQQLILLVTNPGCVDAPGGVPGGGTVTFINAVWPGNAITIAGGPISNSGTFVFNGNGTSNQYIDGQGNLQNFPPIPAPIEFQTNGTPNSVQNLLNLVAGTGVTLTESGGSVTIDVDANVYTVNNGLSPDPTDPNNFQLGSETPPGAPLIHDTYIAGAQFRFEINNTNSMFLQGNRVDIEGGAAGAMMLSTGGAADSSVEVDGTEVAIESTASSNTTKIFLDPLKIRIQTPLYNLKNNGDVLTLIDSATGEVEYMPVAGILLQTDGSDNADQELLNLVSGNGITLTNTGGDVVIDGPLFQTNGTDNSVQTLLNLVAGTGITLTESAGSVTIDAAAPAINLTTDEIGGASTYDPVTGDLNIPIYQTQLDIQDEGSTVAINPDFLNFIGDAVTVTQSGTGADITITGGTPYVVENGLHAFGDIPGESPANPFLFHLGGNLVENTEINLDTAYDLDVLATTGQKMLHLEFGAVEIGDIDGTSGTPHFMSIDALSTKVYWNSATQLDISPFGTGVWAFGDIDNYNNGTKIKMSNLNPNFQIIGNYGSSFDKTFFQVDFGNPSASLTMGDIASFVNGTTYELNDINELHTLSNRLKLTGYNTSTAYQSWTAPVPGTAGAPVGVLNVDNQGNVFVGSGTALAIEVDGTPLSSSTLLNFIPSTDIAVTDAGGGSVQFTLVNPPVTYDSNNGVFNDSNVFKLGSPSYVEAASVSEKFLENRYIYTDTNSLQILGLRTEEAPSYIVNIVNEFTGQGGSALQLDHYGAGAGLVVFQDKAASANSGMVGIAIFASNNPSDPGNNGYTTGININDGVGDDEYRGLRIYSASTNTLPIYITRTEAGATVANTIERFMLLERLGTPANGRGGSIDFSIVTSTGGAQDSNKLISKWFDSTNASRKSQFEIQGSNSGAIQTQFTILGGGTSGPAGAWSLTPGQIKFDRYAAGAIYKSANDLSTNSGFNLGIDADGNIWATDFSTSTGPVSGVSNISIGTLTNGASATVNNPSGPSATIDITGQNAYTQIAADTGTASADTFNSQFSVVGADGITTSVTNGTMPTSDVITVTGPDKYLNFVTKNISGGTIATYTPTIWNETLNIQAGTGITITNGGSANTIVISGGAGTGTVSNVTGVNGNGFTVGVTNGTTTPAITVGTSITGVLVGNGTSVSAVTGTGVMVFSGTGYTFQALPTVNDGAVVIGSSTLGLTNTSVVLANSAGGAFTANKATSSTYRLEIGPAIANLVTLMTAAMPVNPAVSAGATTALPPYIVKTGQDTYTVQTPVTTFSPGSTGFTVTSLVSSATTGPINGAVVLGGSLNVTSGGTGLTTAPGEGQILIGNSTGGFNIGNVSAGTGISVSSSGTGIQISATGITPSVLNGLHIHNLDGSIRLGSGTPADGDVIRPLIERTDIRMNGQIYRLSTDNTGIITNIGFQIDDGPTARNGFFGSSSGGAVTTANTPEVAYIFSGAGGTALTTYNGFYIDRTVLAETKVYSGFSSSVRQVIARSATLANNKLTQVGTWGATSNSTFYEAIPSARTIQIGATAGNNNWIKLDDNLQRVDINKSTIYASGYGSGAVTGSLAYLIGTDTAGKFFEFAGRSISQITGNTGTFSAASMASATAPVPFSIVGAGSISTNIAGNVLTITNAATAFPYWSSIATAATAGSTGSVTGPSPINPQVVGPNTFQFNAGSGIGIRTVAPAVGSSTGALLEITNNGVLSLSTGTTNAFSIVPTIGSPGVFTLNIPYQWRTVQVTNTGTVPAGSGTTSLVPNIALSDITFNGGPGITVNTNTTSRTVTISSTASTGVTSIIAGAGITVSGSTGAVTISGNYNSNNGIYEFNENTFQLGAPSGQQGTIPFTEDRFILGNTFKLDILSTMAAGRGVLHLTSDGIGRALRAVNTTAVGSTPEGAIYASSNQATSTDSNPTGTIYSVSNDLGSAIVGFGTLTSSEDSRPAIFGRGYIGVKGHNTTGQVQSLNGVVAGGIGVYGTSVYAAPVVPGTASTSVWGVVGSTISSTNMLLGWVTNTGTGVYGEAVGSVRSGANLGTGSDLKTFGGRFVINPSGNTALPTTTTPGLNADVPLGIRSMVNVADVLQIVRLSSTAAGSILGGVGGAIVFNIESNSASALSDGDKAGRIGYKLQALGDSTAGNTTTSRSRFFATVKDGSTAGETERLAIRSSGQMELSAYSYIDTSLPPNINTSQGVFTPELQIADAADYANYYDYSVLGVRTRVPNNTDARGRVDTLRTRQGQFLPNLANINGIVGIQPSAGISMTVVSYLFTSLNSVVTCHITGNVVVSSAGAKTINIPLPVPALLNIASDDIAMSWNFNTFAAYTGGFSSVSVAGNGTNQRCTITLSGANIGTYSYSAIITYITYN